MKNLPWEVAGECALPCLKCEVEFSSDMKRSFDENFSIVIIKIKDENIALFNITSFCETFDRYLCKNLARSVILIKLTRMKILSL